ERTGPKGTMSNASPLMTENEYWSNASQYLCPNGRKGALIGKIGDKPWFYIGDYYKEEIKHSGMLRLAINDLDPDKAAINNWNDNSEGFDAIIK
ncbi:MAG: hypothetical protein M3Q64_01960, partial [bacterium]|nr:hypothetical protein [bacterium]